MSETQKKDRNYYINKVLQSPSQKKIVVGGPGTGKTYLFRKLIEKDNNPLILTFINALVEDLSLDLYGISMVRTLHSFAQKELDNILKRKKLSKNNIKIYPKLPEIIREDAKILLDEEIDFNKLFHNRGDNSRYICFYTEVPVEIAAEFSNSGHLAGFRTLFMSTFPFFQTKT